MDMIDLVEHPHIRALFWSTPDARCVDDSEAFAVIDREWKWLEFEALSQQERDLVERLAMRFGHGWIGEHHVQTCASSPDR